MSWVAVGGAAASAAIGIGARAIMNNQSSGSAQAPIQQFQPSGFQGGGFTTSFNKGTGLTIAPTAERLGLVSNVQGAFGSLADELAGLRPKVAPGVSDLRAARLAEIENARQASIGNLRENLQRRRVLGSSFGADALSRAEAEFGQAKDRVAAESFLQEFELTNNLINQQFLARRGQFQTGLDELNLEADLASKLAGGSNNAMAANARTLAELNAREAAGQGQFIGQLVQPIGAAVGRGIGRTDFSSLFDTGATGSPAG